MCYCKSNSVIGTELIFIFMQVVNYSSVSSEKKPAFLMGIKMSTISCITGFFVLCMCVCVCVCVCVCACAHARECADVHTKP